MAPRQCFHCRQWIEDGEAHDCWTTTETALLEEHSEDLRDAYERLRETAVEFGEQRIYASHHSIMFSRTACYFFVRPRRQYLELWIFLGRTIKAPQIRKVMRSTPTSPKHCHMLRIRHRDEVEPPITDWLREAYEQSDALTAKGRATRGRTRRAKPARRPARRSRKKPRARRAR
jgi:hypothetical protein